MISRILLITAVTLSLVFADKLTLRSGKVIDGVYLGGDSRNIRMAVGDKIDSFAVSDIWSLQFGAEPEKKAAEAATAQPAHPANRTRLMRPSPAESASKPAAATVE